MIPSDFIFDQHPEKTWVSRHLRLPSVPASGHVVWDWREWSPGSPTSCAQSVGGCKDAQNDDVQVKSAKGQEPGLGKILGASIGGGQLVEVSPGGPIPPSEAGSVESIEKLPPILLPVKGRCK